MSITKESETSWEMVTSSGERNEYDSITATKDGLDIGYLGSITWADLDAARSLVVGVPPAPTLDIQQERRAFEGCFPLAVGRWDGIDGEYTGDMNRPWMGWLCRATLESNASAYGASPAPTLNECGWPGEEASNTPARELVAYMMKRKADILELAYQHEGKRVKVELRILKVEDHE